MVEGVLWTGLCLLALTTAGPLDRFPRDASEDYQSIDLSAYANYTANEVCFSDNEVFQKGDMMPNPGPCEECRCEPPSIVCQMVKCPVNNNGCRTIQRPNHCCPDYNCECDYNGQLYSDGERLELPDQPCQVCYCKGGEVMCTSLTCYTRSDCEPQHVPGQCCPKYTNCPLRDIAATNTDDKSIQTRSTNKTAHSPKREMQPWLLTNSAAQTSSPPVTKGPGEVTNEDGTVIIVSDWLTERKTTPENSVQGQMLQDVTKLVDPHILSTEKTEVITKFGDSSTTRTHGIVSPPLDEVIFTRIDSLKNQENFDSSTHVVSNLLEDFETTLIPTKTTSKNNLIYEKASSKNDWSTPLSTTTTKSKTYVQEKHLVTEENTTDQPSNHVDSEQEESATKLEFTIPEEYLDKDLKSTDIQVTKEIDREESITKYNNTVSTQKPIKQKMDESITLKVDSPLVNNTSVTEHTKNDKADKIIEKKDIVELTNGFDFKQINDSTNITPIYRLPLKTSITEDLKRKTDKGIYPTYNEQDVPVTNLVDSTTDDIYLTTIFQKEFQNKEKTPMNIKEENVKPLSISTKLPNEENHSTYDTSEVGFTDMAQTTTPYFTEDHMFRLEEEQAGGLYSGSKAKEGHPTTNRQESSTDYVITDNSYPYKEIQPDEISSKEPFSSNHRTSDVLIKATAESGKFTKQSNNNSERFNDSIVVLSSEEAQFEIQEVNAKETVEKHSELPETDTAYENTTHTERAPFTVVSMTTLAQAYNKIKDTNDKTESTTLNKINGSGERSVSIPNVPPVLELNSHVPFLLLGGSDNSDASDSFEDTLILTTIDQSQEVTDADHTVTFAIVETSTIKDVDVRLVEKLALQSSTTNNNSASTKSEGTTISNEDVHPTISSSHIPLTPGDLKVLAEYLIKEKIKPVETSKDSTYSPNQWLQGNLTSEDKIASIMAAANVSVGIMNQTLRGEAVSINTKTNNSEKKDKVLLLKGHSYTDSIHEKLNSEKNVHDKYNNREPSRSYNALPGIFLNDGLAVEASTYPTQDILTVLPQDLSNSKEVIDNIQLQNISNNSSADKHDIENSVGLRNITKDQFQNLLEPQSTSSKITEDNLTKIEYSTADPNNIPNEENVATDRIISSTDGVNNSPLIKEYNQQILTNDANKNTDLSLPEETHHKLTNAPEVSQKIGFIP